MMVVQLKPMNGPRIGRCFLLGHHTGLQSGLFPWGSCVFSSGTRGEQLEHSLVGHKGLDSLLKSPSL